MAEFRYGAPADPRPNKDQGGDFRLVQFPSFPAFPPATGKVGNDGIAHEGLQSAINDELAHGPKLKGGKEISIVAYLR